MNIRITAADVMLLVAGLPVHIGIKGNNTEEIIIIPEGTSLNDLIKIANNRDTLSSETDADVKYFDDFNIEEP